MSQSSLITAFSLRFHMRTRYWGAVTSHHIRLARSLITTTGRAPLIRSGLPTSHHYHPARRSLINQRNLLSSQRGSDNRPDIYIEASDVTSRIPYAFYGYTIDPDFPRLVGAVEYVDDRGCAGVIED